MPSRPVNNAVKNATDTEVLTREEKRREGRTVRAERIEKKPGMKQNQRRINRA